MTVPPLAAPEVWENTLLAGDALHVVGRDDAAAAANALRDDRRGVDTGGLDRRHRSAFTVTAPPVLPPPPPDANAAWVGARGPAQQTVGAAGRRVVPRAKHAGEAAAAADALGQDGIGRLAQGG